MMRAMVPRHGAMYGIQNFMMTMSGFILRTFFPTRSQLKGLQELTERTMCRSVGAGLSEYCVLPGKRKLGYWSVKVSMCTS